MAKVNTEERLLAGAVRDVKTRQKPLSVPADGAGWLSPRRQQIDGLDAGQIACSTGSSVQAGGTYQQVAGLASAERKEK
jgi:hypothetical protein